MKNILFSLVACSCLLKAYPQNGYSIHLHLKPYTGGKVYLGYYYGKIKALADSAMLDGNGNTAFTGKDKLTGGVYFIVSPSRSILFELLIDSTQQFSISADTTNLPGSIVFTGSPENNVFLTYTRFTAAKGAQIAAAQKQLAAAHSKSDSAKIKEKLKLLNNELQEYREDLAAKHPHSLLASLFRLLKEPTIPAVQTRQPGGKYDSNFAYHYYKAHYWDGIDFTDERLTRTPVFEPRLDRYYRDLVPPQADSIEREADMMLLQARVSKPMFQYLLVYFVQKYVNPEYMGQDAVFVHLFEKYINTGQAEFFTEKYRKYLNDRAYSLMANLIGEPAANMEMVDTAGVVRPLYSIDAPFLVICFWDPTCSHCKEIVPKVDSIFQAKWKQEGVKIYGVMVDGGKEAWMQFIKDHNLVDWIHVYETKEHQDSVEKAGQPGFRQLYDVYQTPILYLLDKDKRIIAKKLSYQQLDEVITLKMRQKKSN
ncbi:MAG TPA: thioredoxin-like domain-containing protein [Puia sp.]|nr:thioredoxin-like domain-containing protein [Puia sp.]